MAMASGVGAAVLPPSMSVAGGVVACVVGRAVAAFLLALIPVLQAVKGAADEIAGLAAAIREEVPDTLAAVRLSGLELTDCLEEVGELTHEVGSGVKSTGRAVTTRWTQPARSARLPPTGSRGPYRSSRRRPRPWYSACWSARRWRWRAEAPLEENASTEGTRSGCCRRREGDQVRGVRARRAPRGWRRRLGRRTRL